MKFDTLNVSSKFAVFYGVITILILISIIGLLIYINENQIKIKKRIKERKNLFNITGLYDNQVSLKSIVLIFSFVLMSYKIIDLLSINANSILVSVTGLYVFFTFEIVRQGFKNQKIQLNNQKIVLLERRLELLYYPLEHDLENDQMPIVYILGAFNKYLYLSTSRFNILIDEYRDEYSF